MAVHATPAIVAMRPADERVDKLVESRLGRTLKGKYQLDRVLGVGGMAAVYAATHRNRKQFAIKMLHPAVSLHEDLRERFLREGYAANSVNHPGAVSVIDDDVAEDGSAFLVMELLEGMTVEALQTSRGGTLPVPMVLAIGVQLSSVLAAAHDRGIIHRDLKPSNLFVTREGILKVLDFGIARLRDVPSGKATTGGVVMGTPGFMPPEQVFGQSSELDAQSDIWAAGATLFVLISGKMVHDGDTPQQLLVNAATRPARSFTSLGVEVPASVNEVIERALATDKGQRWSSAASMRDALERAHVRAFACPVSVIPIEFSASEPPERARHALGAPPPQPPAPAQVDPSRHRGSPVPSLPAPASAPAAPVTPAIVPVAVPPPGAAARVEVNIAAPQVAALAGYPAWLVPLLLVIALALGATLIAQRAGVGPASPAAERRDRDEVELTPRAGQANPTAAGEAPGTSVAREATVTRAPAHVEAPRPASDSNRESSAGARLASPAPSRASEHRPAPAPRSDVPPAFCARLLERQSLGDALSREERQFLRERCGK